MIVCDTIQKPLMLLYLIHVHSVTNALVFTKSAESTTRLVKLIDFFEQSYSNSSEVNLGAGSKPQPVVAHAYSSDLSGGERKAILEKFRNADIGMWV
jgi:ATP-dependent RNA helicase DDX51/DBP6